MEAIGLRRSWLTHATSSRREASRACSRWRAASSWVEAEDSSAASRCSSPVTRSPGGTSAVPPVASSRAMSVTLATDRSNDPPSHMAAPTEMAPLTTSTTPRTATSWLLMNIAAAATNTPVAMVRVAASPIASSWTRSRQWRIRRTRRAPAPAATNEPTTARPTTTAVSCADAPVANASAAAAITPAATTTTSATERLTARTDSRPRGPCRGGGVRTGPARSSRGGVARAR